jgi:hypothetical protein
LAYAYFGVRGNNLVHGLPILQERGNYAADFRALFPRKVKPFAAVCQFSAVCRVGLGSVIKILVIEALADFAAFVAGPGRNVAPAAFGFGKTRILFYAWLYGTLSHFCA